MCVLRDLVLRGNVLFNDVKDVHVVGSCSTGKCADICVVISSSSNTAFFFFK